MPNAPVLRGRSKETGQLVRVAPPQERFWQKVDRPSPYSCWWWTAGTYMERGGYGQFHLDADHPSVKAHRYSYELLVGPIPEGLVIDHLCLNPLCVNPAHMEVVTLAENSRRGFAPEAQRRRTKTHCIRGHEFTPENTYLEGGRWRKCRACRRVRAMER